MVLAKTLKTSLLIATAIAAFAALSVVGTVVSLGVACYVSDIDDDMACRLLDGKIEVSRLNK
jgi:hypothetical protein